MGCIKCLEEIDESNFCASKSKWCRPCYVEYHRQYREKNREKLRKQQFDRWIENKDKKLAQMKAWRERNISERLEVEREYAEDSKEARKEYLRAYKEENREKIREAQKRYREKNRDKVNAQAKLNYYIQKGDITRPMECSMCERASDKIEAHHSDYSKPLDVMWLCEKCHKKVHKIIKTEKIKET